MPLYRPLKKNRSASLSHGVSQVVSIALSTFHLLSAQARAFMRYTRASCRVLIPFTFSLIEYAVVASSAYFTPSFFLFCFSSPFFFVAVCDAFLCTVSCTVCTSLEAKAKAWYYLGGVLIHYMVMLIHVNVSLFSPPQPLSTSEHKAKATAWYY